MNEGAPTAFGEREAFEVTNVAGPPAARLDCPIPSALVVLDNEGQDPGAAGWFYTLKRVKSLHLGGDLEPCPSIFRSKTPLMT